VSAVFSMQGAGNILASLVMSVTTQAKLCFTTDISIHCAGQVHTARRGRATGCHVAHCVGAWRPAGPADRVLAIPGETQLDRSVAVTIVHLLLPVLLL
jgi:hypothetical protein